ncbi:MAG: hypothetical protein IKR53_05855, partial [Clostridia bacterium]|nr:hypothetical protein [Clostridia bacterium]
MPSGLNGFGYLDEVRKNCSALPEAHEDVVPTAAQKERIDHLYPQYARLLRRAGWYDRKTKAPAGVGDLYVNNRKIPNVIYPIVRGGTALYPFDEALGLSFHLGSFLTWRKLDGTLKLEGNGHTAVFTVGSDSFTADGTAKKLSAPVELVDGIPMIDFAALSAAMGWKYEVKDGNAYLTTHQSALYEEIDARTEGQWDFNGYDTEGWTSQHMSLTVMNGEMTATSISDTTDPIITLADELAMPADKYTDVELRCRYNYTAGSVQSVSIYFLTDEDTTWNEAKSIKIPLRSYTSGDEWQTLRVSLKGIGTWADTITRLRFDPFNGKGTMEIDCLRFIPVEGYVYVPPEERPFAIKNGDAERAIPTAFFSDNAAISITADPDDAKNHVWLVKAKNGKSWTYFRQNVTWREKTAYTVEYDIRLIEDCEGNKDIATQLCCNVRYQDSTALNGKDHVLGQKALRPSDGWAHVKYTFTVGVMDAEKNMEFTIYANPVGDNAVTYMVDNVVVTEVKN